MADLFGDQFDNILSGTSGNDLIDGGAGNDTLYAGGGTDTLLGGDDDDTLVLDGPFAGGNFNGGSGNDTLRLLAGAMSPIAGPLGNAALLNTAAMSGVETLEFASLAGQQLNVLSTIGQLSGITTIAGGAGTDVLIVTVPNTGGAFFLPSFTLVDWTTGTDFLAFSAAGNTNPGISYTLTTADHEGNFTLLGGAGNDTLNGSDGVEVLNGNGGNDTLNGDGGDDVLIGGVGADTLEGGEGNDTLTGSADADIFRVSEGQDIVTDFLVGTDRVDVGEAGFTSFAQLQPYLSEVDGNAVWSFLYNGVVNTMTLQGVPLASLSASDFIFASPDVPIIESGSENADILLGSNVNDILNGLGGDDIIYGYAGNDTLNGGAGSDTIYTGGGQDFVDGGADNDTLILDGQVLSGSQLNGSTGIDSMVLTSDPAALLTKFGQITEYNLFDTTISSIERLQYNSLAGSGVSALLFYGGGLPNQIGTGLAANAELVGGDGMDTLALLAIGSGAYSLPTTFSYTNWQAPEHAWLPATGDVVALVGLGNFNYVLSAAEGNPGLQSLISGDGDDTLQGSEGMDILSAGGGINEVRGYGGNDALAIVNTYVPGNPTTFLTGAGSLYDGGNGTDFLTIGGYVNFQGALQSIEGIHLQPAFVAPVGSDDASQYEAVLELSGATVAALPGNLQIAGTGEIIVNLAIGGSFNGSGFQFLPNTDVIVTIRGTMGNESITGTGGSDIIFANGGQDTINAGDGDDYLMVTNPILGSSTYNGGAGFDTLMLMPQPGAPNNFGTISTTHSLLGNSVPVSIEAVQFNSGSNDALALIVLEPQRAASGMNTLIGGEGRDILVDVVFSAGTYTMPEYTLINWTSNILDIRSDFVTLVVNPSSGGNFVLNAREGLASTQSLVGGVGNDTLNGSSGSEFLDGRGGTNWLYGNGGNDALILINVTPFGGATTTNTYVGNLFDGGEGRDALDVTGVVNFQGTFVSIERVFFEPSFTATQSGQNSIAPGHLIVSAATAAGLASDFNLFGNGTFTVNLEGSTYFSAAGYTIEPGFTVNLIFNGGIGDDTIIGSAHADTMSGGGGGDMLTGGAGNDAIDGGLGNDTAILAGDAADFTIVYLGNATWQVTDNLAADGDEGVDILSNVEQLQIGLTTIVLNAPPIAQDQTLDTDEDLAAGGQVTAVDLENVTLSYGLVEGPEHGDLVFNPDGTYLYTPDPDYFGPDAFTFTASDGVSTSQVGTVSIEVAPVDNDPAAISGNLTGTITESTVTGAPNGTISGQLLADDPDGPTSFTPTSLAGTWGALTLGADGAWTYELADDDPFVAALKTGDVETDLFEISTLDGSSEFITITINGADDAAVIGGTTEATVVEAALAGGSSQAAGLLTISDVDDLAQFTAIVLLGLYGTFSLNSAGAWTYTLNNANPAIDGLSDGESLEEVFTVFAVDGTSQDVTVTIAGSNDIRTGTNSANSLIGTAGDDTLNGLGGNDTLVGGLGDDILNGDGGTDTASYAGLASGVTVNLAIVGPQNTGGGGSDTLNSIESLIGTVHADTLTGNSGVNALNGGDGNDVLEGGLGNDTLIGGTGIDTVSYATATAAVTVNLATTSSQNTGGAGGDTLSGFENLIGSAFADQLTGNTGANTITGGDGADRLTGGGGADQLLGGLGNDSFSFAALLDSTSVAQDTIFDFEGAGIAGGDLIDVSAIDAIPGGRNNAFTFIGDAAFSGVSGQLRFDNTLSAGFTIVQADTNGDGFADFQLALQWANNGATQLNLTQLDFVL
jgi:VCBS repeat-containing protein